MKTNIWYAACHSYTSVVTVNQLASWTNFNNVCGVQQVSDSHHQTIKQLSNVCSFMTTKQTRSADEDCVIRSEAAERASKWTSSQKQNKWKRIILSLSVFLLYWVQYKATTATQRTDYFSVQIEDSRVCSLVAAFIPLLTHNWNKLLATISNTVC